MADLSLNVNRDQAAGHGREDRARGRSATGFERLLIHGTVFTSSRRSAAKPLVEEKDAGEISGYRIYLMSRAAGLVVLLQLVLVVNTQEVNE